MRICRSCGGVVPDSLKRCADCGGAAAEQAGLDREASRGALIFATGVFIALLLGGYFVSGLGGALLGGILGVLLLAFTILGP